MTGEETKAARKVLAAAAPRAALSKSVFKRARRVVVFECALAVFEHLLKYHQGDITQQEMRKRIASDIIKSALSAAIVVGDDNRRRHGVSEPVPRCSYAHETVSGSRLPHGHH